MNSGLVEEMAEIISFMNKKVDECPSNIYFVSKALVLTFMSQHKKAVNKTLDLRPTSPKAKKHKCSYRYFTSEEDELNFVEQLSQFDSQAEADKFCTCSTLDLIL